MNRKDERNNMKSFHIILIFDFLVVLEIWIQNSLNRFPYFVIYERHSLCTHYSLKFFAWRGENPPQMFDHNKGEIRGSILNSLSLP